MFGAHVWRRDPPCARRRNKEYLLNSLLTIESLTPAFHGITCNFSGITDTPRRVYVSRLSKSSIKLLISVTFSQFSHIGGSQELSLQ